MTKYMSNIYNGVYSVLLGMVITLRQLFKPSVTHQYPYENDFEINDNIREIPVGFRGQLHNRVEDCIVCKKCAQICPVDCIHIDARKPEKSGKMWESMNVVHLKDQTRIVGIIDGKPPKKIEPDMQFTIQHANPEGTTHPDIPAGATVKISGDKVDRIIDRKKVALFMDQFDIDMTLCLFCGLCTEVCPTECLTMKDNLEGIEYSEFDRENLIYKFADPTLYK